MKDEFLSYDFVFIFLFFSLFFLLLMIIVKKQAIKLIFLVLFSLFFTFCLVEFFLSFNMPRFHFNGPDAHIFNKKLVNIKKIQETCVFDRDRNKHFAFNETDAQKLLNNESYEKIYDVTYSLFENGFRYTCDNNKSEKKYIFLGCSFTFGSGVNDNETLPYYFSKLNNFNNNIINFGLGARGTNTALNILKSNLISKFELKYPVKKFIYTLISAHVERNFCLDNFSANDNWLFENNEWKRVKHPLQTIKIFFARSYMFRKIFLPLIDKYNKNFYTDYLIENITQMKTIIENKYQSELTIIVWPSADDQKNMKLFNWLRNTRDFDILFLPKYFDSYEDGYILKDNHPTAKANKEIAQILYNHINKTNAAN